jgi:hypothetical protein
MPQLTLGKRLDEEAAIYGGELIPEFPPSPVIDFNASDDERRQVECTWSKSSGKPTPINDIYAGGVLLKSNVEPPYIDDYTGTRDYYIISYNNSGSEQSNTDSGRGTAEFNSAFSLAFY